MGIKWTIFVKEPEIAMKKTKRKRGGNGGLKFFLFLCLLLLFITLALKYTNERVMPSVFKTMETHGENKSTKAIDAAVKEVVGNSGITTADLYVKSEGSDGRLTSLSANTMLINTLCADVAEEVVKKLEEIGDETVYLPLGILSGVDFLATKGPPVFEITVKPAGHCTVDYKTSFKSEGINQVNYQIWLEIKSSVTIVNPVINRNFTVERRLPVVNTYISGNVPQSMIIPFKLNEDAGESIP